MDHETVSRLREALRGRADVRLALLFGSRARGRETPGSDADVAVEGEGVDTLALTAELSRVAGVEVHVVDLADAGYPLLKAMLRDGIVLHEGERHAEARWRTRAILQTETDRLWWERMRDGFLRKLAGGANG